MWKYEIHLLRHQHHAETHIAGYPDATICLSWFSTHILLSLDVSTESHMRAHCVRSPAPLGNDLNYTGSVVDNWNALGMLIQWHTVLWWSLLVPWNNSVWRSLSLFVTNILIGNILNCVHCVLYDTVKSGTWWL